MAAELETKYKQLLKGKKVPPLVLDNKWHQLFLVEKKNKNIKKLEKEYDALLQKQGKLGTDIKDMKKLKEDLLQEIRDNMEQAEDDSKIQKKQEKNQKLIREINEKTEAYEDELMDIPYQLDQINKQLMVETMQVFYSIMKRNDDSINEIIDWIKKIRDEVKNKMIKKTELEEYNTTIYGYLHDVLGGEVVDVFDIKYLKKPEEEEEAETDS